MKYHTYTKTKNLKKTKIRFEKKGYLHVGFSGKVPKKLKNDRLVIKAKYVSQSKYTPSKVSSKVIRNNDTTATISWKKITKKAKGYKIYYSSKPTSGFKKLKTITNYKTKSYKYTKQNPKMSYYFRVIVYNYAHGKTITSKSYNTIKAKVLPPPAVSGIHVEYEDTGAYDISFNKYGNGANGHLLYASKYKDKEFKVVETNPYSNSSGIIGWIENRAMLYYYYIRTYRLDGKTKVQANQLR